MQQHLDQNFWGYRDLFREWMLGALRRGEAAEDRAAYHTAAAIAPLEERLLQTIWAQQLLEAGGMRLVDGTPLRILDPGRWNGSGGPDFREARLMLGERTLTGDVEIHIEGEDWRNHGHHRDLDYNGVILHVVLRNAGGATHDEAHNGGRIPRFELEPYIFPDLETLRKSLSPDDYNYVIPPSVGRCHRLMNELEAPLIAQFLDRAGDERLETKAARLEDQSAGAAPDQVFHQALLMALGSGPGRTLFYLLAKRTPVAELAEEVRELDPAQWPTALEALLIHVAGLAPDDAALAAAPEESRARAKELRGHWRRFEPYWEDRVIPPTRRWFQGIRPVNFPTRRIAGVAVMLARALRGGKLPLANLLDRIRAAGPSLENAAPGRRTKHPVLMDLVNQMRTDGHGHFWGTHYSFTARAAARPMDLIGEGTALSLVLNAVLPAVVIAARRESDPLLEANARRLFALVPPLQSNHITDFMTRRLFGESERAGHLITTERRRQALFQIFHHCCNSEAAHCETCFYLQAPGG